MSHLTIFDKKEQMQVHFSLPFGKYWALEGKPPHRM